MLVSLHSRAFIKHKECRSALDLFAQRAMKDRSSREVFPRTTNAATMAMNSTRSRASTTDAAKQSTKVQKRPDIMSLYKALAGTNSEFLLNQMTTTRLSCCFLKPHGIRLLPQYLACKAISLTKQHWLNKFRGHCGKRKRKQRRHG